MVTAATTLKLRPNEPRFFPDASAKQDTVATSAQQFHKFPISPILNVAFSGDNCLEQLADNESEVVLDCILLCLQGSGNDMFPYQ